MKDCVDQEINEGDFVIYVVQGNRNAGIEFGWVDKITDKRETRTYADGREYTTGDIVVKIVRSDADGTRQTVEAEDVPGHWHPDTPHHIANYYGSGYHPTREEWNEYYVSTTYRDTGKPSTTTLKCGEVEHRLLVTKPYV